MPIKKIPSDDLEIGMYISSLDRPWTETPFLFQGFVVHSQDEIDEVRQHTQHVYVIVPDEEIELARGPGEALDTSTREETFHQTRYKDRTTFDEEIKQARPSHETFTELFTEVESLVRAGNALPLDRFEQPAKNLVSSVSNNPDAYIWLTRLKKYDSFLYKDSLTAAVWATALGRKLGVAQEGLQNLAIGCMLMDIGKMSLPTELLHKTERLNNEEWELMKSHVDRGVELLKDCKGCRPDILNIVRTHHERLDGCGYPDGLKGDQIPLFGQIAGIVDQYVAVTSPRPYAGTISPSKAEEMLYNQRGKMFDEMLVEYFIQTLSTYPTGSLVELSSGEVGIVRAQKSGQNLRPDVILLLDSNKKPYGTYTLINLDNYIQNDQMVRIVKTLADDEYGLDVEEIAF